MPPDSAWSLLPPAGFAPSAALVSSVTLVASLAFASCAAPGAPSISGLRPTPMAPEPIVVSPPSEPSLAGLEQRLRAHIAREAGAEVQGAEVSVALIDLGTGLRMGIDAGRVMHAASTMKVPVMFEVFRQAEAGELSLDDPVPVGTRFRSIVGDSTYVLTAESDSEDTLYERVGLTVTVRELTRLMIVRSSNLALNLLIDLVGPARVRATMDEIGAGEMRVLRGVQDLAAFEAGLNNTTTAFGFARVLEAIARCSVTLRSSCDGMMEILEGQEFNEMLPARLPEGTRVAHKTGSITGIRHDGGIVFPGTRPPYVLVVMTRGFGEQARADAVGAEISRMVWDELTSPQFGLALPGEMRNTGSGAAPRPGVAGEAATLLDLHARHRLPAIAQRHFGHAQLWRTLEPLLGGTIQREEVGRSGEGRPIHLLRYGNGPTRVLLWSQMHGDEATATMALVDLIHFLRSSPDDPRARRWAERLTILMIPMLNPDGAERFQRHNAYGVDVNRDARELATPEARTLKAVRDRWEPDFGFNLHDQNPRTRVGSSERLAAISLLAPPPDGDATETPGFVAAKDLAATIEQAIEPLTGGYVTRYDDTFNPRAFGDLMQQWGTSTVLLESGGWRTDPEKQYLRAVNFVALVSAFDAIAAGSFAETPVVRYERLPPNGRSVNDLLIRGGTVVLPSGTGARVDIAANFEDGSEGPLAATITEVGDLAGVMARDTLDVDGLFLHPFGADASPSLAPGRYASFVVREGAGAESPVRFLIDRGIVRAAPEGGPGERLPEAEHHAPSGSLPDAHAPTGAR